LNQGCGGLQLRRIAALLRGIGRTQKYNPGLLFASGPAGLIFFEVFLEIDLNFDTHSGICGSNDFAGSFDLISRIGERERYSDFFSDGQFLLCLNKNSRGTDIPDFGLKTTCVRQAPNRDFLVFAKN
jgi:hypothetical protein